VLEGSHVGPASPDEIEAGRKYKKRRRRTRALSAQELRLLAVTVAWAAGGILAGLLVMGAVRRVHDRFLAPKVQELVEQAQQQGLQAGDQHRRGMLLERHSGSGPGTAGGSTSSTAEQRSSSSMTHGGAPNCSSVSLAEADRQLLRREIGSILRSLSSSHPWVLGLPEAQEGEGEDGQPSGGAAVLSRDQVLQVPGVQAPRLVDQPFGPQSSSNIPGAPPRLARRQHS
jgi:hypothetical protein